MRTTRSADASLTDTARNVDLTVSESPRVAPNMRPTLPFATLDAIQSGKPLKNDRTDYVVWSRFAGNTIVTNEIEQGTTEETIIADILSGDLENVVRVAALNTAEGTSHDITLHIAEEVMNRVALPLSRQMRDFLEEHVGLRTVADLLREDA